MVREHVIMRLRDSSLCTCYPLKKNKKKKERGSKFKCDNIELKIKVLIYLSSIRS